VNSAYTDEDVRFGMTIRRRIAQAQADRSLRRGTMAMPARGPIPIAQRRVR